MNSPAEKKPKLDEVDVALLQQQLEEANKRADEETRRADKAEKEKAEEKQRADKEEKEKAEEKQRADKAERIMEDISLFRVVSENLTGIPNLQNKGTGTAHSYPNHESAVAIKKKFVLHHVCELLSIEKRAKLEEWMKRTVSLVLGQFSEGSKSGNIETEADVQHLVNLAFEDTIKICRKILSLHAEETGGEVNKIPDLVTRREMSIFSNVVDHMVVLERRSNVPIFSVESKKFFEDSMHKDEGSRVYGQSLDQLRAMRKKGHPSPFAAICSFKETYITWLQNDECSDGYEKVLNSHEQNEEDRLQGIVNRLTNNGNSTPPLTQSPPQGKIVPVVTPFDDSELQHFSEDPNRTIACSDKVYKHTQLVALFTNIVFCALDAVLVPQSYMKFDYNTHIKVDAIQIKKKSYGWGVLTTKLKEPLQWKDDQNKPDLFLVDYLGAGSTSVVYRAMTVNGCDCVVKMLVARRIEKPDEYSRGETRPDFDKRTKNKVDFEVEAYKKIYGEELEGYVWMQKLNGTNCVVMPFFRPIEKEQRSKVLGEVKTRLEQFEKAKMVFDETDQLWQHVGSFNGKIFLFDLGDLKNVESEDEAKVQEKIDNHYDRLQEKATSTDGTTTNHTDV